MGRGTGVRKEEEALMTVGEVARLLRVPVSWVYERCREGTPHPLPHLKLGKYLCFSRAALFAYIDGLRRGDSGGRIRNS